MDNDARPRLRLLFVTMPKKETWSKGRLVKYFGSNNRNESRAKVNDYCQYQMEVVRLWNRCAKLVKTGLEKEIKTEGAERDQTNGICLSLRKIHRKLPNSS